MGIIVFTIGNILYIPMFEVSSYHGLHQIIVHHYEHVVDYGHKNVGGLFFEHVHQIKIIQHRIHAFSKILVIVEL
jgi:hypothetical protein